MKELNEIYFILQNFFISHYIFMNSLVITEMRPFFKFYKQNNFKMLEKI